MGIERRSDCFKHIPGKANKVDIFTKNIDVAILHGHMAKLCGDDGILVLLRNSQHWSKGGC